MKNIMLIKIFTQVFQAYRLLPTVVAANLGIDTIERAPAKIPNFGLEFLPSSKKKRTEKKKRKKEKECCTFVMEPGVGRNL